MGQLVMASLLTAYELGRGWATVTKSCPLRWSLWCAACMPLQWRACPSSREYWWQRTFSSQPFWGLSKAESHFALQGQSTSNGWLMWEEETGLVVLFQLRTAWRGHSRPKGLPEGWLKVSLGLYRSTAPSLHPIPSRPQMMVPRVLLNKPLACRVPSPESSPLEAQHALITTFSSPYLECIVDPFCRAKDLLLGMKLV